MDRINREYIDQYLSSLGLYNETPIMEEIAREARATGLPILRKPVASLLDILIRANNSKRVLEIGTAVGYSTMVFHRAAGNGVKVVTLEVDDQSAAKARDNFKKAGILNDVTIFNGDAGEILHFMEGEFDFIFMDGPKAQYMNYLPDCIRLLKEGGLLVCDDVLFYGMIASDSLVQRRKITIVKRMRKFLDVITSHPELLTSVIPLGDGLSVSYRRSEKND